MSHKKKDEKILIQLRCRNIDSWWEFVRCILYTGREIGQMNICIAVERSRRRIFLFFEQWRRPPPPCWLTPRSPCCATRSSPPPAPSSTSSSTTTWRSSRSMHVPFFCLFFLLLSVKYSATTQKLVSFYVFSFSIKNCSHFWDVRKNHQNMADKTILIGFLNEKLNRNEQLTNKLNSQNLPVHRKANFLSNSQPYSKCVYYVT